MCRTIRSHKYQEEIYFYTEDIEWNENQGTMTAPGIGNRTEREFDIILDKDGKIIRDIRLHNT